MPNTQFMKVGLLLGEDSQAGVALLIRDLLQLANRLQPRLFQLEFVSAKRFAHMGDCRIACSTSVTDIDLLIVPPLQESALDKLQSPPYRKLLQLITAALNRNCQIHSVCLASFLLAESGLLKGKRATTHWAYLNHARELYPEVLWDDKSILCEQDNIVTAGGLLSGVDLALHIIARYASKALAHEVGKISLADTVHKTQSMFVESLQKVEGSEFEALCEWIESNLHDSIKVPDMAQREHMSLRSFQRRFFDVMGLAPLKYLQLRRIERAKKLLRESDLKIESLIVEVGFSDSAAFRKLFFRELGVTPNEYRMRMRIRS
jgi:transcriptional regulator GlxA family with amidase domain